MRVVAPRNGKNIAYFMKQGILCSASMDVLEGRLDMDTMIVVDYFNENTDMEEAFNALSLLEKYNEESE